MDTVFDLLMFLIYVTTKHSQRNKNSKLLNIVFSLKSEASNSKPLLDVGIFKKKDKLKMTVEHELNLSSVKMQFHGVQTSSVGSEIILIREGLDSKPLACNSYLTHKSTRVSRTDGCRDYLNLLPYDKSTWSKLTYFITSAIR